MSSEERIAQQKRILTAAKAAWRMNPKLRLGQLLVSAMNEYNGPKPRDLSEVDDDTLHKALEKICTKVKAIEKRKEKKAK